MRDGGAKLALDVVANDGQARVLELLGPLRVGSNEDRQAVHEATTSINRALRVETISLFRTNGKVGNQYVSLGSLERCNNVDGVCGRLNNCVLVVFANAVQCRGALHGDIQEGDFRELNRAVLTGENCL